MHSQHKPITRTWDEFWGPLLMVRFHRDNPARWKVREQNSDQLFKKLDLRPGSRVLDMGCGDGLLDICLARLGAKVTAVDRISSVLKAARDEPDAKLVEFVSGDIREIDFVSHSFDLVLMLDLVGLMSRKDETRIIRRAVTWLKADGRLVLDCPHEPDKTVMETKQVIDGEILEIRSSYDPRTRRLHMRPRFHESSGNIIELCDCYADPTEQRLGIVRYLYSKKELVELLKEGGLDVEENPLCHTKKNITLVGRRAR